MKKACILISVLLLCAPLVAQVRTGNIYGKVVDAQGNPLPGVAVTLSGNYISPLTAITTEEGTFRFLSLPPANDYEVKLELAGFVTKIETGIIVRVGVNTTLNFILEQGKLEEQVTVVAVTPMIDPKKTAVATNLDHEALQSLPTARDPWVVMQLAPAIMLDRENVGGNESGQQASFLGRGDMSNSGYYGSDNIWAIDGVDITDPAAMGGSPGYYDFDMFEELNITTGGADVTVQTGGIALNMVTRRGGNKTTLAGRFYLTDKYFQANNLTQKLIDQGVRGINKIEQIKDYGFNAGGPIIKDKLWWWGAYGVQDLFVWTIYGTQDKTLLNNYNFKLNAQPFKDNRLEILISSGAKEKYGRNATVAKPEGDHQKGKYHWGSPIIKIQDEQMLGNSLFISAKFAFSDGGFTWVPMTDEELAYPVVYDQTTKTYVPFASGMQKSWDWYFASRPKKNFMLNVTYFNDRFLGLSHEIKVGAEYNTKHAEHRWGNGRQFDFNVNYPSGQIDVNGDGTRSASEMVGWKRFSYYREGRDNNDVDQYSIYAQDTITKGRFTFMLGLRYDLQKPYMGAFTIPTVLIDHPAWNKAVSAETQQVLFDIMPALEVRKITPDYKWKTWSPRLGITWDVTGDGKTIAKLALAQYGDLMGTGTGVTPPLGMSGWINFWWYDAATTNAYYAGNGNGLMDYSELWWIYPSGHEQVWQPYKVFDSSGHFIADWEQGYLAGLWGSFDPQNPTQLDYESTTTIYDPDAKSSTRTRELVLTFERELIKDLAAQINFTYRKYDNFDWWVDYYPETGQKIDSPDWYIEAGTVPDQLAPGISTGDAAGKTWYVLDPEKYTVGTDYSYVEKSKSYSTYWGIDFVINKRLAHKWFMNASVTLQDQRYHWNGSYTDPTNKWVFDGRPYAMAGGGASGKTAVNMYTRWMVKISAMYQLPLDFNVSVTFNAREGWRIPHYFWIEDERLADQGYLNYGNWVYTQEIVKDSLPTFYQINLRIEKMIKVANVGRLYFMADIFNLLNSDIVNRAYDAYIGDYYIHTDGTTEFVPNPTNRLLNEILNPRIMRLGVRFQF
ncbi:MAG TPA: carboxypeptidase regulatory-like domain-containing protein [Candidatus Saccharicenans sp.]|nr:carboxypeptidase regulatory-like domain-containing protein [Candidatus Saccharicenans sp.]